MLRAGEGEANFISQLPTPLSPSSARRSLGALAQPHPGQARRRQSPCDDQRAGLESGARAPSFGTSSVSACRGKNPQLSLRRR